MSPADLMRQVAREGRLIERAAATFADDLDRVMADLRRESSRLVGGLEVKDGRLQQSPESLARVLALRGDLKQALARAGYPDLAAEAVEAPYDALTVTALKWRQVIGMDAAVTDADLGVFSALKDICLADLLDHGDNTVTALWRAVVDGVVGARNAADLSDELSAVLEVSQRQARTLYDTATSQYSRQVDQVGWTPTPGDRFLYVGPEDSETRPFCRAWLGKIVTRKDLDSISNGQLPNTLLTAGGYNCRHKWQPIFDLTPKEVGANG